MPKHMRFLLTHAVSCMLLLYLAAFASAQNISPRPCDLLQPGSPCVAAISTTRALYSGYRGPLYRIMREADRRQADVGLLPDGYADAAQQEAFCAGATCTIVRLYDQSPFHNDLTLAPAGGAASGPGPHGSDIGVRAAELPVTVAGHRAFGMRFEAGMGYRNDHAHGTATHGRGEGVYMLTSTMRLNRRCCFDFGNAETNNRDNRHGHMDAINIRCKGSAQQEQMNPEPCEAVAGLDMEDGIPGHYPVPHGAVFATVMGVNDGQHTFAIYTGAARSRELGSTGRTPLPAAYQPMKQEGAIILGIGGDNSNNAIGNFFEGVMTIGTPDAGALNAIQADIVGARYSAQSR